jgi:ElaA protein
MNPVINWQWASFAELTAAQLYGMLHLRQQVFVVEQRCIYHDADGLDPRCLHSWGSTLRGDLAAYARVVPPGHGFDGPAIGRVVVAPAWRASGLGGTLMGKAIELARRQFPGQAVWISAQAHLQAFYARLGFTPTSEPYDDEGIPHLDMRLAPLQQPATAETPAGSLSG